MWFLYALLSVFLMALVLYTDEHLATSNKLPKNATIHTKVGSVLLISTLMCFVGAGIIGYSTGDTTLSNYPFFLAVLSGIPMAGMYASYFYLLQSYPVHLVGPLFQISAIWLLGFELVAGGSISVQGLVAIILLVYGAYILDAGTLKWKIPTKLLLYAIPATLTNALILFMARLAGQYGSPTAFSFYQLISTGVIGVILFIFVGRYREGFLYRIKHQGKKFLGLSAFNETFSQGSFWVGNIAVAAAPVGAYVSAMAGVQNIFVLLLLWLFPHGDRAKVTRSQWVAVSLIAVGVMLIER